MNPAQPGIVRMILNAASFLWPFIRPYRIAFWLSLVIALAGGGLYALSPWLVGLGIDRGILRGDPRTIIVIALAIGGVESVRGFLGYAGERLIQAVGQKALADLREQLFKRSLWLPSSYFMKEPTGRVVTRITNDVQSLAELFQTGLSKLFLDLVLLLASLGGLLWLDLSMFILTALSIPLMALTFRFFSLRLMRVQREVKLALSKINAFVSENFSHLPMIRILFAHHAQIRRFEGLNEAYFGAQMGQVQMNGLFQPAMRSINALSVSALLWAGGAFVLQGRVEPGALVAGLMYIQQMYRPLRDMTEKYSVLLSAFASLERIEQFCALKTEAGSPILLKGGDHKKPLRLQRGLTLKEVSLSYDGKRKALDRVSLTIEKGERVALVGETGAGKSSLTSLILRFYEPSEGLILWDGRELGSIPLEHYRKTMAWVPQSISLFSGTVLDNLTMFDPSLTPKALDLLEQAKVRAYFENKPSGLAFPLQEGGRNLSLGERQLIGILRALIKEPEFLVLDEATSALDPLTESLIQRIFDILLKEKTALIVAHRLYTVQKASEIIVLEKGRVIQSGNHDSLLRQEGPYSRFFQEGPFGFFP